MSFLVDGDMLLLFRSLVSKRGLGTCAISEVEGHADDEMVRRGSVRQVDKVGSDRADEAADFDKRRVTVDVTECREHLVQACQHWFPIACDLHRLFIAIAQATVNDDGLGVTACNPLLWRAGSLPKRHIIVEAVREFVMLPGLCSGGWQGWPELSATGEACIGRLSFTILVLVVSLLLSFLFCMRDGLVEVWFLTNLFISFENLVVQFRCQLPL